jgi:hypothetical protein
MNRWIINTLGIVSICAVCLIGWAAYSVGREVGQLSLKVSLTFSKVNQALDTVNALCAPGPCGTLANVDKVVVKVGDAIVQTQLVERGTSPHVIAAMDTLNASASKLGGTADALTGTAQGATQTLAAASTDLKTLDTSLTAFPPLLERSTATVGDLDALLKDKAVYGTLDNVQSMTSSGSAILIDARTLADKTTGDILKPKPWWQKIGPYGNDLVRAGCLLTGRCP